MKRFLLLLPLLFAIAACNFNVTTVPMAISTPTSASDLKIVSDSMTEPTQTVDGNRTEEAAIRTVVENFGKRLQEVSLLSPEAAQEIQQAYSDLVSPALLEAWMNDVSKSPGRMVSSPWPDRIDINTLTKDGVDNYRVTGDIIEVTSVELVNGGAAAKIPVRLVIQREQDRWVITEYTTEQ